MRYKITKHRIVRVLLLSAFCFLLFTSNAQIFSQFAGSGTSWDPYQITDTTDLKNIGIIVGIWGDSTSGKYFKLMNNIDMTGVTWTPIGNDNSPKNNFQGYFDGNGKIIRNLTCYGYVACFFYRIKNATIMNLGIENCDMQSSIWVGGLVGSAVNSTISNCYVTGHLKGYLGGGGLICDALCTNISNCYFLGNISTVDYGSRRVGGLVGTYVGDCTGGDDGYSPPTIMSNCYVMGGKLTSVSLTKNGNYVGGLVGYLADAIVRNCIVALDSLITNSNTTSVPNPAYINPIVGIMVSAYPSYNPGTLQNNYALNTMVVQDSNGNVNLGTRAHNTIAGADIPLDSLKSFAFYNRAVNWYQMPWSIQNPLGTWKICDGVNLPFLRYQGISCNYAISATAGKNGSISPAGTVIISDTASQKFTFSANPCYTVDSLWIDGVYEPDSISAGSYTFNNITTNHSIKVSFKHLPQDTVIIRDTTCYGTDYTQNGFTISNATTDSVYFKFNMYGCDTVTRLELTVNPVYFKQIDTSICRGDTFNFHGNLLTESDVYYDTLQTISGCDSIIELTLTVISIDTTHIYAEICEGESYDFFGNLLTTSGVRYHTLQSVNHCDSVIELTLTVTVGVVETQLIASLPRIYPNPTTGKLKIENGELKMGNVEIYDIYGRKFSQFTFHDSHIEIDISHLSAGIYFLRIDGKTMKLVKV